MSVLRTKFVLIEASFVRRLSVSVKDLEPFILKESSEKTW